MLTFVPWVALILVPAINDALDLLDNDVLVFGIGLVVLTFLAPEGIAGVLARWRLRRAARPPKEKPTPEPKPEW